MKRSNLLIALYLVLLFLAGGAAGVFAYRLYAPPAVNGRDVQKPPSHEDWRRQYLNEMQTRLKLSTTQVQQLNSALDETRARFDEAHRRSDAEIKSIREDHQNRVKAFLSDVQRPEYDKIIVEHQRAREQQQKK
ncbi:MAG TPA: hypothetical protein VKU01_30310 [Bryobacteraceae bacterium]|nr:hypothetical protein [Bryobacteraceae bacterium]